ncbi:MAG TPA: helix-turn-helix domain-containing protein, partial [Kofleriaceae bacterium]|nr:helix-turn-helix domain-containing protein [Kofleriaceae bacterium]
NIRELEHVIEGEINLASAEQTQLTEVPTVIQSAANRRSGLIPVVIAAPAVEISVPARPATLSMAQHDRQLLVAALVAHDGSIATVARVLGLSRGTVYNKMKKFGIDRDNYRIKGG